MEARADALSHEIQAADERSRASLVPPRGISATDIAVGERCAQAGVSVLDRLNEEVAAQGGTARILAVDCHEDGWVSTVRLNTPTGASYVLMGQRPGCGSRGAGPPGTPRDRAMTPLPRHGEL
jgi:hypothetical protein